MSENPIVHLFEVSYKGWSRRLQQKSPRWARWYGLAVVGYLVLGFVATVAMAFYALGPRPGLAVLLAEVAGFGLLLLPLSTGAGTFMALQSLCKGRCLEEIMSAGLPAARIVDGLVLASLRHHARITLGTWLFLLAGSLGLLHYVPCAPVLAGLWLPAVVLLAAVGSYTWGRLAVLQGLGHWTNVVAGIAAGFGSVFLVAVVPEAWTGPAVAVALVAALGSSAWLARRETIYRLEAPQPATRKATAPRRAARPLPEGNPLIVRETMRRLSWSRWTRHWDAVLTLTLALLYGLAVTSEAKTEPAVPLLVFWWILLALAPLRAAFRSLEVFQADRQSGSLESLLTSRLTAAEAVEGAARLGWERPLRELLIAGALFLPLGLGLEWARYGSLEFMPRFTETVGSCLVASLFWFVALFAGSYLGVAAGLRSASRQEAWMKLFGWVFQAYFMFWLACATAMPVMLLGDRESIPVALLVYLGVVCAVSPYILWRWTRSVAYRKARHSAQEPGFA